jgi:hypothetical protein
VPRKTAAARRTVRQVWASARELECAAMAYRRRAPIAFRVPSPLSGRTHGLVTTLRLIIERWRHSRSLCADALVCSGVLYHRTWRGATSGLHGLGIRFGLDSQEKLSPAESCHRECQRARPAPQGANACCAPACPASPEPDHKGRPSREALQLSVSLKAALSGEGRGAKWRTSSYRIVCNMAVHGLGPW